MSVTVAREERGSGQVVWRITCPHGCNDVAFVEDAVPWKIGRLVNACESCYVAAGGVLCDLCRNRRPCRKHAATDELVAALRRCEYVLNNYGVDDIHEGVNDSTLAVIRAAIAKATGEG